MKDLDDPPGSARECPACGILGAWDEDYPQYHRPDCPNAGTGSSDEWEVLE